MWLGDKTKDLKKDEGHVNLPSKIFQSYDTIIILKMKLGLLISNLGRDIEGRLFNLLPSHNWKGQLMH